MHHEEQQCLQRGVIVAPACEKPNLVCQYISSCPLCNTVYPLVTRMAIP